MSMTSEKLIGKVTHYYNKLGVAVVRLNDMLEVGQTVHIKGKHDDFTQEVEEMQFDHHFASKGIPWQRVGIKVREKTHANDLVYAVV